MMRAPFHLYLQPQAEPARGDIRRVGAAIHADALKGISDAEEAALANALRKVRANLSSR